MAEIDTIICHGSSVKRGLGALLSAVPGNDMTRWLGPSWAAALAAGYPIAAQMPGVRLWTPRLPYSTWNIRPLSADFLAAGNAFSYGSGDIAAQHPQDSWLFIQTAASGQGLIKRIATHAASAGTILGTWGSNLTRPGTIIFFKNSHTVNAVENENLGAPPVAYTVSITRTAFTTGTPASFVSMIGKMVNVAGVQRRIVTSAVVNGTTYSTGADKIVFDDPVEASTITAGTTMFIVLDGASSAETLAGIATGASLQTAAINLNNSPAFLTGIDYPNYDLQPAIGPPTTTNAVINSDLEMYLQFRSRFGGQLCGIDLERDSAMLAPRTIGFIQRPFFAGWQKDITQFDFHPTSTSGLYQALTAGIDSLAALLVAENNTMRARVFVSLIAENDQILSNGGSELHKLIGTNLALLRDAIRTHVGDERLPFIAVGPGSAGYPLQGATSDLYPYRQAVYDQLEELVMDDPYTEFVDLRDAERYTFVGDLLHLTAVSQINLGVDIALAYDRIVAGNASTEIDICNLALSHIGEGANITSLDPAIDSSAQARHCARFYPRAIEQLIEGHPWDFATRRADLELIDNPDVAQKRPEWTYAYEAPKKMAGAIAVLNQGSRQDAPTQPFIKEADASGRVLIYTDTSDAVIRYNRLVTNTRRYSTLFIDTASLVLASMLAGTVVKGAAGVRLAEALLARASVFMQRAQAQDSKQRQVEPSIEAPWMPGGDEFRRRLGSQGFPLAN